MKSITTLLLTSLLLVLGIHSSNAQNCGPSDDIVQNSTTGGFGVSVLQGQTFEATCTGPIEDITLFVANANNNVVPATLELYQGQFTGSQAPIATTTEVINSTSTTVTERFDFVTPVDLVAGQTYSFVVYNTAGIVSFEGDNTNPYPDGVRLFIAGSQVFPAPTTDLRFRVGYEDNDPPNAVCMDVTLSLGPDGTVVISPNDIDGGSNGGIATSFVLPNILTCDDLGENEVELTVGDISGNFASCDATVTIVDDLPPAFTGCQDITVNTDIGQCTAVVNYADNIQVTDNCGIDIIDIFGPASGSAFPIGTTEIEYSTADIHGNISGCTFTITVEDNEGPVINCPTDVTINCASLGVTETITGTNTTAINIPDNDEAGTSSMIAIAGVSSANNVLDMSVELSIDHTWVGDLTIDLVAPTGETLSLVSVTLNDSSDLDQNFPITFTDAATTSANNLGSGLAGPGVICQDNGICEYHPSAGSDAFAQFINTLSANGSNLNGDWILNLADSAGGDEGSLEAWNITINTFDPDAVTATVIDTDPSATGMATAADSCGGDVVITFSDTVVDGCGISETITRTWTATDEVGNISTCDQIISIVDTIAPTLTSCPEDVVTLLPDGATGAIVTYDLPTAEDVCGDVTITQTEGLASGVEFPEGITTNTFSITDPCGNETICSFTVTVTTVETTVALSGGALTITDINGGISDDDLTLSNDGTTLTISNLVPPVAVSGSVVPATDTSVTVTLAAITHGITINGVGGTDNIEITEALSLTGLTNSFSASNINNFVQSAALTVGGDLLLTGNGTSTIDLGEITAGSLMVTEFNTINDTAGQAIIISGSAHFAANNTIDIEEGQNNHTFGDEVSLQATNNVFFTAGATTTFGEISAAGDGFVNDITVLPGDIIFNNDVTLSGNNANLFVCGIADITQTSGSMELPFLILRGNGNTTASLNSNNDIGALATSNPFDANAVDLASLSFTNSTNMFLEVIHVDEFDLTAPEFDMEPDFTVITKEGTGESNFNANIDLNNGTGTAIINHNAGTINFNGETNDFISQFTYNGVAGTITNINSDDTIIPQAGPNRSFTFGFLNASGNIEIGDSQINILDTATFSGSNTLATGFPFIVGGPTVIENDATITPSAGAAGGGTTGLPYMMNDLVIRSEAVYAPLVDGTSNRDRIIVTGTVTLTNALLAPTGGYIVQAGDEVILIDNDDTDAVTGTFNDLPEGSGITFGDFVGIISYVGGDGNDVVLVPDTIDPVAVCQDLTLTVGVDGITVTGDQLDGGSTDNAGINEFLINGQASIDFTLDDVGDQVVTITVVDPSGNTAECTATITLVSNVNATLPILISEYQPLPTQSNNGPNQTIEIKGASGESFVGSFVIIDGNESRSDRGQVVNATDVSGTFNAEGILTASVPNFTNPAHTAVLTSAFNGTVDVTDIDTDNDGTADDLTAFGDIFDAVGVQDGGSCCPINISYGDAFGGVDLGSIGSPPAAIFREASEGDFFQISNTGIIYDSTGAIIDASVFDSTPTVDGTFGTINPLRITTNCSMVTTWDGTDWDNGEPDASVAAIINGDYDTDVDGNIIACEFFITSGFTVNIGTNGFIDIQNDITVNGILITANEGSIVQRDDNAQAINNGTIQINKTTPSLEPRDFILLGSPMTGETNGGVYASADRVFGIIESNFIPNTDPDLDAVVANFIDDNGDYLDNLELDNPNLVDDLSGLDNLIMPGTGYLIFSQPVSATGAVTFDHTYTQGTLNNGVINRTTTYNGPATSNNFNLLGNPYASAIDVHQFIMENDPVNEVYYWEHITQPDENLPGFNTVNFSMDDVSVRNLTGGIASMNGGTVPGQFMSSGQGFAILADQTFAHTDVVFNNSMRTTGNNSTPRSLELENRLWLQLEVDAYTLNAKTLIGFIPAATPAFDFGYDSDRLQTAIGLFSTLDDGSQLSIQGRETFDPTMEINLGFVNDLPETLTFTISINQIQGAGLELSDIFLIDHLLNTVTNLKDGDYTFTAEEGIQEERFTVVFDESLLNLSDPDSYRDDISLYPNPTAGILTIAATQVQLQQAVIYDMTGRLVREFNMESVSTQTLDVQSLRAGSYMMQLRSTDGTTIIKRFIKE